MMFHRTKRLFRHIWIGWRSFRDARHPIPFKPHEPELLADVPGDTVFALIPSENLHGIETRPVFIKGEIEDARIEENGSLSYRLCLREGSAYYGHWFPAHLCTHEKGYKRWLLGLLEKHGYKPFKIEHIAQVMQAVVGGAMYEDLIGAPD